ncbi:MAG: ABC transporter substrate-binding protein [Rhodospirillaceae bacterium]
MTARRKRLLKLNFTWMMIGVLGLIQSDSVTATTLRVGASDRPPGLGNPYESIATGSSHSRAAILDALLRQDGSGQFEPALALRWTSTSDLTWEFKLRPNTFFSNGEPVDAAAVKATLDFLTGPDSARYLIAQETRAIARTDVIDAETIVITTSYPDAILPKRLSLAMIVPPKAFAEMGLSAFAQAPIGSGSYVLEDWGTQSGLTILTANPTSWRAPEQIDRVEIRAPLREAVVRLQALRSGQVDITLNINVDEQALIAAEGFINTVKPIGIIQSIGLPNMGNPDSPLQDVRVRRALNYAVNKEVITDIIMGGTTQPVGQGAIPESFGYNPDLKPYPYDPDRARALLKDAGYAAGFTLNTEVLRGGSPTDDTVYIQVAQDLARVGVTMNVRPLIGQEWIRKYFSGDWGSADALSVTWNADAYADTIRGIETFSCAKPGVFFCEPSLTPLIEQSNRAFETPERERLLKNIMAQMHDLAPSIFLYNQSLIISRHPRVENVVMGGGGFVFEQMRVRETVEP